MKIIKANAEILHHDTSLFKFIERVGRICYKSENKITNDSAVKFTQMLAKNNHTAMLEHETLYFVCPLESAETFKRLMQNALHCGTDKDDEIFRYIKVTYPLVSVNNESHVYISASLRVFYDLAHSKHADSIPIKAFLFELHKAYPEIFDKPDVPDCFSSSITLLSRDEFINSVETYLEFPDYPVNKILSYHLTHTVLFTCDRGVSHELVRHRPVSFAQESTRYCNYTNDKFGNELTFIEPCFWNDDAYDKTETSKNIPWLYAIWHGAMEKAESAYLSLIKASATPQQARDVLPTSVKTEIALTATELEWKHILNLRYAGTTGTPHPQMKEVMDIAYPLLEKESNHRLAII